MSDVFDTWKQLSYAGIVFPFSDITIKGAQRHYLHEFIRRPGGEVEKLARRAYQITVRSEFVDTVIPRNSFARYVDLYPSRLSALLTVFEQGDSHDLFLPMQGRSLRCKAVDWTRNISAARRSGESVTFEFLEDSTEEFLSQNLVGVQSASIVPQFTVVQREVEKLNDPVSKSALDRLIAAVGRYLDAVDRVTETIDYQTARIDTVVERCSALADTPALGMARAASANRELIRFMALATRIRANTMDVTPMLGFVVPDIMDVLQVSTEVYGTPANATSILRYNDFDDAMAIPRGTTVRYKAAA